MLLDTFERSGYSVSKGVPAQKFIDKRLFRSGVGLIVVSMAVFVFNVNGIWSLPFCVVFAVGVIRLFGSWQQNYKFFYTSYNETIAPSHWETHVINVLGCWEGVLEGLAIGIYLLMTF